MTSHFIWHSTFLLHLPKQAHKTVSYCKELQHTRHGPLAKHLPRCLKADAWIREECIWEGEAWHTKTKVWLKKGGEAHTGKFNIPEARKPLKSGEPHEKQVPVGARGLSGRGWEAQRHNYASSCDWCESCQKPRCCCTRADCFLETSCKVLSAQSCKGKASESARGKPVPKHWCGAELYQHEGDAPRWKQRDMFLCL